MHGRVEKRSKDSWTIIIEKGRNPVTNKRERIVKTIKGAKRAAEREMYVMLERMNAH